MDENTRDTLEHVADECERLERACRDITPPLARLLGVAAWIAVEAQIKAQERTPIRRFRISWNKSRKLRRLQPIEKSDAENPARR
jgi:hypothetical protein